MKIAITVHYLEYSSKEFDYADHLGSLGHDVTIYTSGTEHGLEEYKNFTVKRFPTIGRYKDLILVRGFKEQLLKDQPEIIHSHEYFQPITYEAFTTGIPFTFAQHKYYPPRGRLDWLGWNVMEVLAGKGIKRETKLITAISSAAKRFLVEMGVPDKKVEVIPHGVNTRKFTPSNRHGRKNADSKMRLLYVGRFSESKGLPILFEAYRRIHERYEVDLFLAGGTQVASSTGGRMDKGQNEQIMSETERGDIVFLGWVPHSEMPEVFQSADIFVLPSLREPFGVSILEAMSCGIPVIATNVGGIPDIIDNEVDGLLVEPENLRQLEKAILTLLEDETMRRRLREKALEKIQNKFDYEVVARRHLDIYRRTIERA